MEDLTEIGYIVKTHGYKGDLRIRIHDHVELASDMPAAFFISVREEVIPYFTTALQRITSNEAIIHVESLDNKEDAQKLKGSTLYLRPDDITLIQREQIKSDTDEFVGYTVEDISEGPIGVVREILAYPQQEMLAIDHNGKEILIPVRPELIHHTDKDNKHIIVDLPGGFLEI